MPAQKSKYQEIVKKFRATKILVVGDLMLDLYIRGDVERISPEAPVPVVFERLREYSLGGAGNVAANIAALGGRVTLMGGVGNDSEGKLVYGVCRRGGIIPRFAYEPKRPTSLKTRATSGHHQLLRIDREKIGAISKDTEKKVARLVENLGDQDLVVVSDYTKGFITEAVVGALKKRFGGKKIVANIKPAVHIELYKGINTLTLNAKEGHSFTGIDTSTDKGAVDASRLLSNRLGASVVLTRGEHGLTAYDHKFRKAVHVANHALHVFDVTGAGDTVIATLALMLGTGAPLFKSAEMANRAGGIVVGLLGTAVVRPSDLKPFLD
jgi:rfaE bifunctional protein kinase chain/domain